MSYDALWYCIAFSATGNQGNPIWGSWPGWGKEWVKKKWSRKTVGQCVSHVNTVKKKIQMPCFISKTTHKINEWVSRLMSGCPCSKWFLLWCGLNKSRLSTVIGEPSKYWKVSRNWLKIGRGNMEGQICGIVRSYGSREIYVFFWKTILSECYTRQKLIYLIC